MLGVALFVVLAAAGAASLVPALRIDEEHALAGLFGDAERERVIARRAIALLERAEALVRLAAFDEVLRTKAWKGVPLMVSRVSPRWSEWTFADGARWLVRHRGRAPKRRGRLVVAHATATRAGLAVEAYGPGGESADATLEITDASELAAAGWGAHQHAS